MSTERINRDWLELEAPAKTNLWLRVLGKRADGFHEIDTRMVALDLADQVAVRLREDEEVLLDCDDETLPTGEGNLVVKAVRALEARTGRRFGVEITLQKRIPSGAGLGGGSSDAAAVIRAIDSLAGLSLEDGEMAEVAATIGSDIPFFVYNRPCDCQGRGEIVVPVEEAVPALPIFLFKPGFSITAAWAYQNFAKSAEYDDFSYSAQGMPWGEMVNDLEKPVYGKFPVLGDMKNWLLDQEEVRAALLSGSGSTMLAVLEEGVSGEGLRQRALERYGENSWSFLGSTIAG